MKQAEVLLGLVMFFVLIFVAFVYFAVRGFYTHQVQMKKANLPKSVTALNEFKPKSD